MKRLISYILLAVSFSCLTSSYLFINQQQPQFKFTDTDFNVGATLTRRLFTFTDICQTKLKTGTKTLDSLYKTLVNYPNLKIEVGVYASKPCKTCTSCSPTQSGAETLKAYLIKKGIADSRIVAKGYGLTQPLVKESDKNALVLNARMVIKIIYNKF
jgi:hypothetical protein